MQKHVYEDLPEVLFQEEALLRSIRQEFTTIVLAMKMTGRFNSREEVGLYSLSNAIEKLIAEHALATEAIGADISGLKDALGRMPYYIGSLDTLEDVINAATACANIFSFILKMFGGRVEEAVAEKVRKSLEA